MTTTEPTSSEVVQTGQIKAKERLGDRIFSRSAVTAGVIILVVLAAVATFLVIQSLPALQPDTEGIGFLRGESFWAYAWPLIFGTLWASFLALLFATPIALGIALFISHYAPRRIASVLGYIIDLLAAVPSVVFGLWGGLVLAPLMQPIYVWLNSNLNWIPFFGGDSVTSRGTTILTAALVLAIMVIPIMTAICREIFLQTPTLHEEASLALGATRWEMIRMAVLPFARGGMVSAAMLGLGRALGETMAVAMVLSPAAIVTFIVIAPASPTPIPANIALKFPEANPTSGDVNVLIATGLVLFIITFAVNALARWIVARRAEFSGAN